MLNTQVPLKHFRSTLSPEFRRHYVLSGGTQLRTLSRHQSKKIKTLNIWKSNPQPVARSNTWAQATTPPLDLYVPINKKYLTCTNNNKMLRDRKVRMSSHLPL